MRLIAVSQRVDIIQDHNERRDSLDQSWVELLSACNLSPVLIPNNKICAEKILANTPLSGVVLTGGNDLVAYGGNAPERDETENFLLQYALDKNIPLLGVCRGMQIIQCFYGIELMPVQDHVNTKHDLLINKGQISVNSYHNFVSMQMRDPLEEWAISEDGLVEDIRHKVEPITGVMWHPERNNPFEEYDVSMLKGIFWNDEI